MSNRWFARREIAEHLLSFVEGFGVSVKIADTGELPMLLPVDPPGNAPRLCSQDFRPSSLQPPRLTQSAVYRHLGLLVWPGKAY
jgi:hypothetical protein